MPEYDWNTDKDELLRRNRSLSFYDVVYYLEHGGLLGDIEHPNQERYPARAVRSFAFVVMPMSFPITDVKPMNISSPYFHIADLTADILS